MSSWSPLIATHATAAAISLLIGGYQLARRVKGDAIHRRLGWLWVTAMTFVATSSFAIHEIRHGQLSLLHVLSIVTLASLIVGIIRIRRGQVSGHRAAMRGSWYGLLGAGIAAAVIPGRRIPVFTLSHPADAAAAAAAIVLLTITVIALAHAIEHWHPTRKQPPASTTESARIPPAN